MVGTIQGVLNESMKIYYKILLATLPLVLVSLISGAGITYYLSQKAITDIAVAWLETRLSEAVRSVESNEEYLRRRGMAVTESDEADSKAKALEDLKEIFVGYHGLLMVLDENGRILLHPDSTQRGRSMADTDWFPRIVQMHWGHLDLSWAGRDYLSVFEYYWPWGWYVVVIDPHFEVYGSIGQTRDYVLILAISGSVFFALLLIIIVRRLTVPLAFLVLAAQKIGEGKLGVRIPVFTRDEFGQLSQVFNDMADKLQKSLGDLRKSERHFRSLIENASDLIVLLNRDGSIRYLSPSIERILGLNGEGLTNLPATQLIPPENRPAFRDYLSECLSRTEMEPLTREFPFRHQDHLNRIFEVSGRNLLHDPSVNGLVLNARDVTLRKQVESELAESAVRLQDLTSRLLTAQESERRWLSIELHDEIGQSLTVLKLKVATIEKGLLLDQDKSRRACHDTMAAIDQVIEDVRRLCTDLSPSALEDLGLTSALIWLVDEFARHNGLKANIDLDEIDGYLNPAREILVYRIFQETLTNIGKHARATSLKVEVRKKRDALSFLLEDNGCGFDIEAVGRRNLAQKGLGLTTIEERARMLEASFKIHSDKGAGTRIQFTIPLKSES